MPTPEARHAAAADNATDADKKLTATVTVSDGSLTSTISTSPSPPTTKHCSGGTTEHWHRRPRPTSPTFGNNHWFL